MSEIEEELRLLLLKCEAVIDVNKSVGEKTPMTHAISSKNVDLIKRLLQRGASLTGKNISMILDFAEEGSLAILKEELATVSVEIIKKHYGTVLIVAIMKGYIDIANMFLDAGVDINVLEDKMEPSCLMHAVSAGSESLVQRILAMKANIMYRDREGATALSIAARKGFSNIFLMLINAVDGGWKPDRMHSLLISATIGGNAQIVQFLLSNGESVKTRDKERMTALSVAAEKGHYEIAALLIKAEADIHALDKKCYSPLLYAAMSGGTQLVKDLIALGADVNWQSLWHETALMLAVGKGHKETADVLIAAGARVDIVNRSVVGLLNCAAKSGDVELVRQLLPQCTTKEKENLRALPLAAKNNQASLANLLIDGGVSVNSTDKNGWTALMYFAQNGNVDQVSALIDAGAAFSDKTSRDKNTHNDIPSALQCAVESFSVEMVKLILSHCKDLNLNILKASLRISYKNADKKDPKKYEAAVIIGRLLFEAIRSLLSSADSSSIQEIMAMLIKLGLAECAQAVLTFVGVDHGPDWLFQAVKDRQVAVVEAILAVGVDVNCQREGMYPLHAAIRSDSVDMLNTLLQAGSDIEAVNESGETALMVALKQEKYDTVRLLISAGANVHAKCKSRGHQTVLMYAVATFRVDIVKIFINAKVNLEDVGDLDETALLVAASKGDRVMVEYLIDVGADITKKNKEGAGLLYYAVKFGWNDMVMSLPGNEQSMDAPIGYGRTPLMVAAEFERLDLCKLFLNRGASVDCVDERKNTALILAASTGNVEIVRLLLDAGADVNACNKADRNALICATEGNHCTVVELLITKNISLEHCARMSYGRQQTALSIAMQHRYLKIAQILIDAGCTHEIFDLFSLDEVTTKVDFSKLSEDTLPHAYAKLAQDGKTAFLRLLLDSRFDIDCANAALISAAENGVVESVDVLLQRGANPNALDRFHCTALIHALRKGNLPIAKLLLAAGANPIQQGSMVPLSTALEIQQFVPLVPYLLDAGAVFDVSMAKYLYEVSRSREIETVRKMLDAGLDVNTSSKFGKTALVGAVEACDMELIELLINAGAQIAVQGSFTGVTSTVKVNSPLMEAIEKDYVDIVQYLLEKCSPDTRFTDGSVLELATRRRHFIIVHMLLRSGKIDFHAKTSSNDGVLKRYSREPNCSCSLVIAAERGDVNLVQSFLEAGADIEVIHYELDQTPLAAASNKCYAEVVEILLAAGAKVDATMRSAKTALMFAASRSGAAVTKLLVAAGANVHLTMKGKTALDNAIENRAVEVVQMLVAAGAYCQIIDGSPTLSPLFTDESHHAIKVTLCSRTFLSPSVLQNNMYDLWFLLVQVNDVDGVEDTVRQLVTENPDLVSVKDGKGRMAVDIATSSIKFAINSVTLWFGKYRPAKGKPEHTSATCFVVKAMDESGEDPMPVALKLMRVKSQFARETEMRKYGFDGDYVMVTSESYPCRAVTDADPDVVEVSSIAGDGMLSKAQAESLYCVVMPLAERNMYVAMKQERFAGKEDVSEVVTIFSQLVKCVVHMHSRGVLHGDIKPMNMVRMGGKWLLIDLDACCVLGRDSVGFKSSSAYVPPEAVYADAATGVVCVKSESVCAQYGVNPLIAHESFDVWSLGCILYQLCSSDVLPLFAAGQDDNLNIDSSDVENSLWSLCEWSDKLKEKKLSKIRNLRARNLLSLMLSKDAVKRPTLSRVLGHPFLSAGESGSGGVGRMAGEAAEYDVFISYRVSSDLQHASRLYEMLTIAGLRVWWDKKCLESGKEWQKGFCRGLSSSTAFLCILSKSGTDQPFQSLSAESFCDNVLLEHRLALELKRIDYVKYVFPIMIGDAVSADGTLNDGDRYSLYRSTYNEAKCHVVSVEDALKQHLDELGLGTPLTSNPWVCDVANEIRACNGYFIGGRAENTFENAVSGIVSCLKQSTASVAMDPGKSSKSVTNLRSLVNENKDMDSYETLVAEYEILKRNYETVVKRNIELEARLK